MIVCRYVGRCYSCFTPVTDRFRSFTGRFVSAKDYIAQLADIAALAFVVTEHLVYFFFIVTGDTIGQNMNGVTAITTVMFL